MEEKGTERDRAQRRGKEGTGDTKVSKPTTSATVTLLIETDKH